MSAATRRSRYWVEYAQIPWPAGGFDVATGAENGDPFARGRFRAHRRKGRSALVQRISRRHPSQRAIISQSFLTRPLSALGVSRRGWTIEKNLRLIPGENTVILSYTLLTGNQSVELELRPVCMRGMHEMMYQSSGRLRAQIARRCDAHRRDIAHAGSFHRSRRRIRSHPNWYLARSIAANRSADTRDGRCLDARAGAMEARTGPHRSLCLLDRAIDLPNVIESRGSDSRMMCDSPRDVGEPNEAIDSTLQTLILARRINSWRRRRIARRR